MIILVDNRDSFVYNLVDALHGHPMRVFRNHVPPAEVLAQDPELIILSPGPGHPRQAGTMMELIRRARGRVPILGICLGLQALLEDAGGEVRPCGAVHGETGTMRLSPEGARSPLFRDLADEHGEVPIARYHSLGARDCPPGMRPLAWSDSRKGAVVMAAEDEDGMAVGLQFHPESVLSPSGPAILDRAIAALRDRRRKDTP